jgi:PPK2 family polyphosphate:nucleotide phosphotransferase
MNIVPAKKHSKVQRETFVRRLRAPTDGKIALAKDYDPGYTGDFMKKSEAEAMLEEGVKLLAEQQDRLYAQNTYSLLLVFQAMDAAGKDGTIKHVMSGINPQGCQVYSFKAPSEEELDHDFLWRCSKTLPERGRIGIFNRSYYEEVLAVRVHPEFLERQHLPPETQGKHLWKRRFEHINAFEKLLHDEGTRVLKFFLHISKDYQKEQLQSRLDDPQKRWKFNPDDVTERARWDDYQQAFEAALSRCSTAHAPWHIIPAERHWYRNLLIASACVDVLEELNPKPPHVDLDPRQYKLE